MDVVIKGQKVNQDALRKFLDSIDIKTYEQDDGQWKSPVTGELFPSLAAVTGHLGSYLRKPRERLPLDEPTRAGYVRAIRAGAEPTVEQKEAHRAYQEWYRTEGRWRLKLEREERERITG